MFKKIIGFIMLVVGLLINFSVFAEGQKIEPPYPEVWGYDLSKIAAGEGDSPSVNAYLMEDGDVWFLLTYYCNGTWDKFLIERHTDFQYVLIKFFTGETIHLSKKQGKKIYETLDKSGGMHVSFCDDKELVFKDGSKLKFNSHYGSPKCFDPEFRRYFLKTHANGLQTKHLVFGVYPEVEVQGTNTYRDLPTGPFYYEKLHVLRDVIPLKDDTFILFKSGGNVILRFDKNFNTNFKSVTPLKIGNYFINRNFFVIDHFLINYLGGFSKGMTNDQGTHDLLLEYFFYQYREKFCKVP